MSGKGCGRLLLCIAGGIFILIWVLMIFVAFVGIPDDPVPPTVVQPTVSQYTPRPTTRTRTPRPTPITYSAANLATHTAVVAERKRRAATASARKSTVSRSDRQDRASSRTSRASCISWFVTFDKYHLLNLADLETIADMMNPEGSYYHYGSKSEVRDAVHFHAEAIVRRARTINTTLPDEMPDNIRFPKEQYANAYYEIGTLLLNNFDGYIGPAPWAMRFMRMIDRVAEVNGQIRRTVSSGRKYCI